MAKDKKCGKQGEWRGWDGSQKYLGNDIDGTRRKTGCRKWGKGSGTVLRIPAVMMGSRVDNLGWWVGQKMLVSLHREVEHTQVRDSVLCVSVVFTRAPVQHSLLLWGGC